MGLTRFSNIQLQVQVIPWSRVRHEKLLVAQLFKKQARTIFPVLKWKSIGGVRNDGKV